MQFIGVVTTTPFIYIPNYNHPKKRRFEYHRYKSAHQKPTSFRLSSILIMLTEAEAQLLFNHSQHQLVNGENQPHSPTPQIPKTADNPMIICKSKQAHD